MNLRSAMLVAVLGLAIARAEADRTPTIDFFKHPQYRSIKISPGGDYLATTVPEESRTRLAVFKVSDLSPSTVFNTEDQIKVEEFFWVSDHRLVFNTSSQLFSLTGLLENPRYTGYIYAGNADGSAVRELPGHFGGRIPHSDNSVIVDEYGFDQVTINRLNVDTGHREQLDVPPFRNFNFWWDADGQIRYLTGVNEHNQLVTQYRRSNADDWTTLSTEPNLERHTNPLGLTADMNHVYLGTSEGVFLVDLQTNARKLVSHAADVNSSDVVRATDLQIPIGIAVETDYPRTELFDPEEPHSQMIRMLERSFKDSRISITSLTNDGKLGVARVSSDINPGEFFLVDFQKKQVSSLLKTRPWINPAQMASMEAIQVKARDGTILHGYLTVPRGSSGQGLPTVVMVHGGPHRQRDVWGFVPEVQFLASRGYAVLQINYRGSYGFGHDFQAAGYKHWGTTMQDDVTDATLWAIKDGVADTRRICIAGYGYGGYSALMGVIREPDLYRCGFAYDGIYNLQSMFESGDSQETVEGVNYLKDVLGTDPVDLRNRSPVNNVARIKVPLFLAHGESDSYVPFAQFREMTAALDKAGKPYEKLVKSKEEHGFYNEKNSAELYDRLAAFLDKNIGAGAAAMPAQPAAAPPSAGTR